MIQTECELVVQVNGKLRDRIWVAMDASEEDGIALAFTSEKIKELTEGKTLRKVSCAPRENHEPGGDVNMTGMAPFTPVSGFSLPPFLRA